MAQRQGKVETVREKTFSETFKASEDEVMLDPEIKVSGLGYPLDKAEYLILTRKASSESLGYIIGGGCLGVALAYLIEIIAREVEALADNTISEIESWKVWALEISLICALVCYLVGRFLPSEKKKLLKEIKERLYSQPKTVESRRKYKSGCRRS